MPLRQQIIGFLFSLIIFSLIVNLVYKRNLKEEYSWLWMLTGGLLFLLIARYELLEWLTRQIGATHATSTLFFCAILFLMLLCIQFSIVLTTLSRQVKTLSQEITLLRAEFEKCRKVDRTKRQTHDEPSTPHIFR